MDANAYKGLLESVIRERRLALWDSITKLYEVEYSLNVQVHKWIADGTFTERARSTRG